MCIRDRTGAAPLYYEQRWSGDEALFNQEYFVWLMAASNYTLYWRAEESWQGKSLLPSDVYYPAQQAQDGRCV